MKEFSIKEKAAMKRIAANVDGYLQKKNKLVNKIEELKAQVEEIQYQIDIMEAPVKAMTGYHVEEILKKVVVDTGKSKIPKYEFIYDTIIPQDNNLNEEIIPEEVNL